MEIQTQEDGDPPLLPFDWLDRDHMGRDLYRLIPSKIPVDGDLNNVAKKQYTIEQVFSKQENIRLVIDLTSTSGYYDSSRFPHDVQYLKISCTGYGDVPKNEDVNIFIHQVNTLLDLKKINKCLVHCTLGYNRTGYMIVHYLVRILCFPVTQALGIFSEARPPGINNKKYINALYFFYHINRPKWPFPKAGHVDDDEDSGFQLESGNDNAVWGDIIPKEQEDRLRSLVLSLVRGEDLSSFSGGSQCLTRDKLSYLTQGLYVASWKAVGDRFWMLLVDQGCFLIDKDLKFRRFQMRFPNRVYKNEKGVHWAHNLVHNDTLLDGQIITETEPKLFKGSKKVFVIDDVLVLNSTQMIKLPFLERYSLILDMIVQPRNREFNELLANCAEFPTVGCYYKYSMEPFTVRRRELWPLPKVEKELGPLLPTLFHEADGLVFKSCVDEYKVKPHQGLLQWSYPAAGAVDSVSEGDIMEEFKNLKKRKTYSSRLKSKKTNAEKKMKGFGIR